MLNLNIIFKLRIQISLQTIIYNEIRKDNMGRTGHWDNDKRKEKVWSDNLKGDLGADMRILLKCISNVRGCIHLGPDRIHGRAAANTVLDTLGLRKRRRIS